MTNIKMYKATTAEGREVIGADVARRYFRSEHYGEIGEDTPINNVTSEFPIDVDRLAEELRVLGWGEPEISAIVACVDINYSNVIHRPEHSI